MKVKEIMTRGAEIVGPDTIIMEAARKMKDNNIGSLPVTENDRLVGMVTDREQFVLLQKAKIRNTPGLERY